MPATQIAELATQESDWATLGDIPRLEDPLFSPDSTSIPGSGNQIEVRPGDPLIGLPISPLLPPTDYAATRTERLESSAPLFLEDEQGAPLADIHIVQLAPVWALETDANVSLTLSSFFKIFAGGAGAGEEITKIDLQINGLPVCTQISVGTLSDNGDGSLSLNFSGTQAEFETLTLTLPKDLSSSSRNDFTEGNLSGAITTHFNFVGSVTKEFNVRIIPVGDAIIDDSLPDTVPDEIDAPTSLTPSELLAPMPTDVDGSEIIDTLVLEIDGLPVGSTIASLGIMIPGGVVATMETGSLGTVKFVATFDAAVVGDVVAAYNAIALTLPVDFSTANRNDLSAGTSFPISVKLSLSTDEDRNPFTDTPTDGTVVTERC